MLEVLMYLLLDGDYFLEHVSMFGAGVVIGFMIAILAFFIFELYKAVRQDLEGSREDDN